MEFKSTPNTRSLLSAKFLLYLGPGRSTRSVGVPRHERHTPRSLGEGKLSSWGEAYGLPRQHLAWHREAKQNEAGASQSFNISTSCSSRIGVGLYALASFERPRRRHYVCSESTHYSRHTTTEHMILYTFFATNGHNLPPTCKRFLLATNTSRRASSTQKHDAPLVDGTLANGR